MTLLRPFRTVRAPLKLALLALALFALYHLAAVLPSSTSSTKSTGGAYPTPDPLLQNPKLKLTGAAKNQLDYDAERRRWSEAQRMRHEGNDPGAGAGERYWAAQAAEEGGPREWAPKGRGPPRRVAPGARKEDARARPAPAGGAPAGRPPVRMAGVEARRKAAAERERQEAALRPAQVEAPGGTYDEELAAAVARKARQREKLREWDERVALAEEKERGAARGANAGQAREDYADGARGDRAQRVAAAVRAQQNRPLGADDDDELDAAPRGAGAGRRLGQQRKKGPLIQVGGAQAAAALGGEADDALIAKQQAAQAAAAAKDRGGKGWDQRFKRPAAPPVVLLEEGDPRPKIVDDADAGLDERDGPPKPKHVAKPAQFDHRLVARFAAFDYAPDAQPGGQALVVDPDSEDSFQIRGTAPSASKSYNLTICALVPNENRFIGEWLLYHRLLGVERFALYDTSTPGAFGAAEVDALADRMQREGGGELGPTVEELKASVGTTDAGPDGLDEKGEIRKERIAGMERWIDQGVVKMHWLKFADKKKARDFHSQMLDHCTSTYGPSSNWLAHLDVDEFLSVSTGLYSADAPYRTGTAATDPWQYPLHDVLARPAVVDAACIPLPELSFRNLGVRELGKAQGVLETQTHRDVLKQGKKVVREEGLQQKTLIHTAYSSKPIVYFAGPHSCEVASTSVAPPEGLTTEIRNSQGALLQDGGLYEVAKLPIEPLAIAHYLQRDLRDCLSKLSSLSDPNDIHSKTRGALACEEHYLPSPSERLALEDNQQNRFLLKTPPPGTVVEDKRISSSWAAQAARDIRAHWLEAERAIAPAGGPRLRGKGRMAPPPQRGEAVAAQVPKEMVKRARRKVEIISI